MPVTSQAQARLFQAVLKGDTKRMPGVTKEQAEAMLSGVDFASLPKTTLSRAPVMNRSLVPPPRPPRE